MTAPLILRKMNGAVLANFLYEMDFQVCSYKKWTLSMWGGHILLGERVWRVVKQNVKWIHSLLMTLKENLCLDDRVSRSVHCYQCWFTFGQYMCIVSVFEAIKVTLI